jgi:hypothetical protein
MKPKISLQDVCFLKNLEFILIAVSVKKKHGTLGNPVDVDADNFLLDVDVQSTHEDLGESRVDNHRDVDEFFHAPVMKEMNGKKKKCCTCKLCPWALHSL